MSAGQPSIDCNKTNVSLPQTTIRPGSTPQSFNAEQVLSKERVQSILDKCDHLILDDKGTGIRSLELKGDTCISSPIIEDVHVVDGNLYIFVPKDGVIIRRAKANHVERWVYPGYVVTEDTPILKTSQYSGPIVVNINGGEIGCLIVDHGASVTHDAACKVGSQKNLGGKIHGPAIDSVVASYELSTDSLKIDAHKSTAPPGGPRPSVNTEAAPTDT